MIAYRYITGPDDAEFCQRITAMLNDGWSLASPATLTYDNDQNVVICGQPMQKDCPDTEYRPGIDLSAL